MRDEIFIEIMESSKKDIITVVNARTSALEFQISSVEANVKNQNITIGELEKKVGVLDDIAITRGLTCLPQLEELKPLSKTVKYLNYLTSHKILASAILVGILFIIQSIVFILFGSIELQEIVKLIYK